MAFEIRTIPYKTPKGDRFVLRTDRVSGFKCYWIEARDGRHLTPQRFYNEGAIYDILHDVGSTKESYEELVKENGGAGDGNSHDSVGADRGAGGRRPHNPQGKQRL